MTRGGRFCLDVLSYGVIGAGKHPQTSCLFAKRYRLLHTRLTLHPFPPSLLPHQRHHSSSLHPHPSLSPLTSAITCQRQYHLFTRAFSSSPSAINPSTSPPPSTKSTLSTSVSTPQSFAATYQALPPRKRRFVLLVLFLLVSSFTTGVIWNLQDEEQRSWQLGVMKSLPLNLLSRLWGNINRLTLPVSLRAPLYNLWTYLFHCNLEEAAAPLESYANLSQFFSRQLKEGVRPIAGDDMVSPVDGEITVIGQVGRGGQVEQIKGMTYSVGEFLGFIPNVLAAEGATPAADSISSASTTDVASSSGAEGAGETDGSHASSLHYIVMYLAPGDYHRIHNPCFSLYHHRRHFPGHLYPVNPVLLHYVPNLFIRNERVVLAGKWRTEQEASHTDGDRFFSMCMVGAYNVGSVKLSYDEALVTNQRHHFPHRHRRWRKQQPQMDVTGERQYDTELLSVAADGSQQYVKVYGKGQIEAGKVRAVGEGGMTMVESREDVSGLRVKKGEEVARFELGSTVVLLFETLKGEQWQWKVKEGQKIKMGQPLGVILNPATTAAAK